MAEVTTYGLSKILSGEPTVDGSMPTSMTEMCKTYRNSCEFVEDAPELKEEFSDQEEGAIVVFSTAGGKMIRFSTYDHAPETLTALKGGAVVDDKWAAPTGNVPIFKAISLVTDTGMVFDFPKVRVMANFNSKFMKDSLALIEVSMKPLSPGAGKPAMFIGKEKP